MSACSLKRYCSLEVWNNMPFPKKLLFVQSHFVNLSTKKLLFWKNWNLKVDAVCYNKKYPKKSNSRLQTFLRKNETNKVKTVIREPFNDLAIILKQ